MTPNVVVAYLHPGDVSASFTLSLCRLLLHEQHRTGVPPYLMAQLCGSGGIVDGRNQVVEDFLGRGCEWLLFVDSDMGFAADALERLLASADPQERPVVGGLCFAQKHRGSDPATGADYYFPTPTLYRFHLLDDVAGFEPDLDYPQDAVVRVDATGAAFLLAHRSALETVGAAAAEQGVRWFDRLRNPRAPGWFSEDLSFCLRAAHAGVAVHVNTAVKTSHHKGGVHWDEKTYHEYRLTQLVLGDLAEHPAPAPEPAIA